MFDQFPSQNTILIVSNVFSLLFECCLLMPAKSCYCTRGFSGLLCSPLHAAALHCDTAVLTALIEAKADTNAKAEVPGFSHSHSVSFVGTMYTLYLYVLVLSGSIWTIWLELLWDVVWKRHPQSRLSTRMQVTNEMEASAVEGEEDLAHGLSDCHALHVARLQNAKCKMHWTSLRCLRNV